MPLLTRVYFNAVFGALGGLFGWLLFGLLGDPRQSGQAQWLLGGAILGGCIGGLVTSVEALLDRSPWRFCRLASVGLAIGASGGALGMWAGENLHYYMVEQIGVDRPGGRAGMLLARGLAWMLLGLAVGAGEGMATRSLGKLGYGLLGGALGGLLGGVVFGVLYQFALRQGEGGQLGVLASAMGLVLLGACIGGFSALMPGVLIGASLQVLRGWQEGRSYLLAKSEMSLGRAEQADITLFRDMRIDKQHAILRREGSGFVLINLATPEQTLVNEEPVSEPRRLADGDRIQVGEAVLRVRLRARA